MAHFTHFDDKGKARMVDVSDKKSTDRLAIASGTVTMASDTLAMIAGGSANLNRYCPNLPTWGLGLALLRNLGNPRWGE